MADINIVILVGRLTRDIEVKYSGNGYAVGHISIAINRRRKNGDQWVEEASFFDVTVFGKTAESLKPYLTKGKQVAVEGALQQDRWEKDGQKFSRISIVANNIQLLGNGGSGNGDSNRGFVPNPAPMSAMPQVDSFQQQAPVHNNGFVAPSDGQSFNMDSFPEDFPEIPF